jgi:hypothetical protein
LCITTCVFLLQCAVCYCVFFTLMCYVIQRMCKKLSITIPSTILLFLCNTVIFVTIAKQNKWSQDILIFTKTRNDFSCARRSVILFYYIRRAGRWEKTSCMRFQWMLVYYHVLYVAPRVCCLLPCVICITTCVLFTTMCYMHHHVCVVYYHDVTDDKTDVVIIKKNGKIVEQQITQKDKVSILYNIN